MALDPAFLHLCDHPMIVCSSTGTVLSWTASTLGYLLDPAPGKPASAVLPGFPGPEALASLRQSDQQTIEIPAPDGLLHWSVAMTGDELFIRIRDQGTKDAELCEASKIFQVLHTMQMELADCSSLDELYRRTVELALEHLHLDRFAVLLFDIETRVMRGTFGTDTSGKIVDERSYHKVLPPDDPWAGEALKHRNYVMVWEKDLFNADVRIGHGWNAMTALWDGPRAFGWLVADNLIHHQPISPFQRELLGLYGKVVAALISSFTRQQVLESEVKEKTRELSARIEELERTRAELIEAEKFAALGAMVAGMAHEINTPLGNALTGVSFQTGRLRTLSEEFASNSLTQRALGKFLSEAAENLALVEKGLNRAIGLVGSFKKLAVDQTLDEFDSDCPVGELVRTVCNSYAHLARRQNVALDVDIPSDLRFPLWPGSLEQIVSNLVGNSLYHAFPESFRESTGSVYQARICVSAEFREAVNGQRLLELHFSDNGCGIAPAIQNRIFEPFFTTRRGKGGTGLGLAIALSLASQRFGGHLEYQPATGGGSLFILRFPEPKAAH